MFITYELDQLTCTANTHNDPCDLKASNNKVAGSFHGHLHVHVIRVNRVGVTMVMLDWVTYIQCFNADTGLMQTQLHSNTETNSQGIDISSRCCNPW